MVLFLLFLANFYAVLYVIYPRAGDHNLPIAGQFNTWHGALYALVMLAFMGDSATLTLDTELLSHLSNWQRIDIGKPLSTPSWH